MADHRITWMTEVCLSALSSWYMLHDQYRSHRDGVIRRLAIKSKCWGLVHHDRNLIKATKVIYG